MSDRIEIEAELEQPPQTVWRALTEPALVETWLAPGAVPAELGGPIDCELLEAEPPGYLRLAWRSADGRETSEVTFTVAQNGDGSRIRIVHAPQQVLEPANDVAAAPMLRAA